jgi:hypothetical protein
MEGTTLNQSLETIPFPPIAGWPGNTKKPKGIVTQVERSSFFLIKISLR